MKKASLVSVAIILICVACGSVPQTHILYSPGSATAAPSLSIRAPKDVDIVGFDASRDNQGHVHLKFDRYTARMNPDVISAQGAREVDIINAVGAAAGVVAGETAKAMMGGAGGLPAGTSRPVGTSRPIGALPSTAGAVTNPVVVPH